MTRYMYMVYNPFCFLFPSFQKNEVCFVIDVLVCENLILLEHIYGWRRYSTMNVITTIGRLSSIYIKRIIGWQFSILEILSTVTIFFGLMKWPVLLYTTILGGPVSFLWNPIEFWIIFRRPLSLTVYNHIKMYFQQQSCWKNVMYKCFDLTY